MTTCPFNNGDWEVLKLGPTDPCPVCGDLGTEQFTRENPSNCVEDTEKQKKPVNFGPFRAFFVYLDDGIVFQRHLKSLGFEDVVRVKHNRGLEFEVVASFPKKPDASEETARGMFRAVYLLTLDGKLN